MGACCTYGGGLGAGPHRGDDGHELLAWGVGMVQSPGLILEGPEEGPGAPGAAAGQTGWLRPDTGGIPAGYMYICMCLPLTGCHPISRRVEQDKAAFGCSNGQDNVACTLNFIVPTHWERKQTHTRNKGPMPFARAHLTCDLTNSSLQQIMKFLTHRFSNP